MTPKPTPASLALRTMAALAVVVGSVWFGPGVGADHDAAIFFRDCVHDQENEAWQQAPPTTGAEDGCIPIEGRQFVRDAHWLYFEVDAPFGQSIQTVHLYIHGSGEPSPEPVQSWSYGAGQGTERLPVSYEWKTGEWPRNDLYAIDVRVITRSPGAHEYRKVRPNIAVDNFPETPRVPLVSQGEGGISVTWEEALEVDAVGYRLLWARTSSRENRPSNDDFKVFDPAKTDDPQKTSVVHDVSQSGTYWYRLRVLRHSVVAEPGVIASAPSPVTEPVDMVVATPEPEVTAPPRQASTRAQPNRPRLTPRPIPRVVQRPAPVSDAPYSAYLPFDLPEGEHDAEGTSFGPPQTYEDEPDDGSRQGIFAATIGAFLVAAALAIGRMPS